MTPFTWSHYFYLVSKETPLTLGADSDKGMDPKHFFVFNIAIGCLFYIFREQSMEHISQVWNQSDHIYNLPSLGVFVAHFDNTFSVNTVLSDDVAL